MSNYIKRLIVAKKEVNYCRGFFKLSTDDIKEVEKLLNVKLMEKIDSATDDFKWKYTFTKINEDSILPDFIHLEGNKKTEDYELKNLKLDRDTLELLVEIIGKTHLGECEEGY